MKLLSAIAVSLVLVTCWYGEVLSTPAPSSYESPYGASSALVQSPYTSPAVVGASGGQGWNSGQSAGSYYHYHVPVVGQQHHYQPQAQSSSSDIHHQLLWIIPLLLLLLAPALLLPLLLKFLLLPIGLSLLGLILPLLMMAGMMMMMMMMGGDMMMPMRNRQPLTSVTSARTLGHMLLNDWTSVFALASRSVDVDSCPEMLVCELGGYMYPQNSSSLDDLSKKQLMTNYIVEQLIPRGRLRKLIHNYKEAFWSGTKSKDCSIFTCQPTVHLFGQRNETDSVGTGTIAQLRTSQVETSNLQFKLQPAQYMRRHSGVKKEKQHYVSALNTQSSITYPHVEEIVGEP